MRTGKGKTFRIILKNARGVGKIKVISFLGGSGQNRAVTPYFIICNIIFSTVALYKSMTLGSYIK